MTRTTPTLRQPSLTRAVESVIRHICQLPLDPLHLSFWWLKVDAIYLYAEYSLKARAFPNDTERARHLQAFLREPNQIKGKKGAEREEPLFPCDVVKHISGLGLITVGRWPRLDVSIKWHVVWMAGRHQMVSVVLSMSPASVQHRCLAKELLCALLVSRRPAFRLKTSAHLLPDRLESS